MFSNLLTAYTDRIKWTDGNKYYLYADVWADYAKESLAMVYLYMAVAIAVILVGIGLFVKFKKSDYFIAYLKIAATIAITFAVTVIVTMVALGFEKINEKGYFKSESMLLELVPTLVLAAVIIIGAIASFITSLISKKAYKITLIITLSAVAAAVIATVVCLMVYYSDNIAHDGYYNDYGTVNQIVLYVSAALLIVAEIAAAFILGRHDKAPFDSRCIALAGITIALSFALSYIKFFELPQGGSLTLASLLPVMLFAYVYGPKKGILVGFIYGLLQAIQDPYIIHPAQFLLDYPIAFSMVGFAGVFANIKALDKLPQIKFTLGAILAGALRFAAHVISGVFAFSAYALEAGQTNLWAYSTAYNSFVFIDLIIVIVVGAILFTSKAFNKQLASYTSKNVKSADKATK